MGDVYLGAYSRGPEQRPVELQPTVLHKVADAVRLPASGPAVLAGAGWFRHSELKTAGDWTPKRLEAVLFPRARFLLGIGASRFREKRSVSPADVVPDYVRHKVASVPSPSVSRGS